MEMPGRPFRQCYLQEPGVDLLSYRPLTNLRYEKAFCELGTYPRYSKCAKKGRLGIRAGPPVYVSKPSL